MPSRHAAPSFSVRLRADLREPLAAHLAASGQARNEFVNQAISEKLERGMEYTEIPAQEVPAGARFDVPRQNQGQIAEVAYSTGGRPADECGHGDLYQRVTDRSDRSVTYYKRTA